MNDQELTEITVEQALTVYNGSHIGNDLLLIDEFADIPLPNEPRRMGCLLIAFCLQGKAQYTVDTKEYMVCPNDIIIINSGQVTDDYMLSRDCSGFGLMLSYNFFRDIVKGVHELSQLFIFAQSHPVYRLEEGEGATLRQYFDMLKQKLDEQQHHFRKELVQSLLTTTIYDLSNALYRVQNQNHIGSRAEKIFADFIRLVEQNFRSERRACWYARQLCITSKYLTESVRTVSRRTPNEWIDNYVTLEIRVLLKNSMKSIKEIAQELHFPNQSFLGRYFLMRVGMTPSAYRKQ